MPVGRPFIVRSPVGHTGSQLARAIREQNPDIPDSISHRDLCLWKPKLFLPTAPRSGLSDLVNELELDSDEVECSAECLHKDIPLLKVFSSNEPLPWGVVHVIVVVPPEPGDLRATVCS